jgi:hypothetical protein
VPDEFPLHSLFRTFVSVLLKPDREVNLEAIPTHHGIHGRHGARNVARSERYSGIGSGAFVDYRRR